MWSQPGPTSSYGLNNSYTSGESLSDGRAPAPTLDDIRNHSMRMKLAREQKNQMLMSTNSQDNNSFVVPGTQHSQGGASMSISPSQCFDYALSSRRQQDIMQALDKLANGLNSVHNSHLKVCTTLYYHCPTQYNSSLASANCL
jgi:hypothetical protein